MEIPSKQCISCAKELPLYEFFNDKSRVDKKSLRCRACFMKEKKPNEIERIRKNTNTIKMNNSIWVKR